MQLSDRAPLGSIPSTARKKKEKNNNKEQARSGSEGKEEKKKKNKTQKLGESTGVGNTVCAPAGNLRIIWLIYPLYWTSRNTECQENPHVLTPKVFVPGLQVLYSIGLDEIYELKHQLFY